MELETLMAANPDLNVNQVIAVATEHCYATRAPDKLTHGNKWRKDTRGVAWKLSNADIFRAVKKYNEMRKIDESRNREIRVLGGPA